MDRRTFNKEAYGVHHLEPSSALQRDRELSSAFVDAVHGHFARTPAHEQLLELDRS